ncbi:nitrous oxide reductase family maturation protein NosD [Rhodocytophaga aerolata]|uniref:Nitrous oxide reductase family maturation protein NosD n=1 Tax=Rhodocytophaga aerolata TaxID=455078 RepID=A0ABT8RBR5_9BACT|nr:nitrous oxide reductase family maturation protein NosD [Rhodocytophaga aerolata]MDO1448197.1 nitrous oxide reductase family maturation protein NosD [Rhodocytophaga aerolata]
MEMLTNTYSHFIQHKHTHNFSVGVVAALLSKTVCMLSILLIVTYQLTYAQTLEVRKTGPIQSIKKAIQLAQPHDTISIREGIYLESEIIIDKPLTIIGRNNPVIDGQLTGEIITIQADSVVLEGVTLQNVKTSAIKDYAAVRISRSKHCTIRNNHIKNAFFGIYLEKADSCRVQNNRIHSQAKMESTSGNGIHVWYCNTMLIEGNQVSGHRDGIYFEFVSGSKISGNTSTLNLRYGLHFMFSNGNEYRKNHFIKNGSGVAVMYAKEIVMEENTFENNWGAAAYGILLKDITDSRIEKNRFVQNTVGIHAEGTNRTLIQHNEFSQNGWALRMMGSCEDLRFENNNFISNTFEVATSNNYTSSNTFTGNYWSSYTGYDLDKDGVGDVAHKPVKLFTYLMEDVPTSMVLIRSLFIDLLELAEKVAPVLTPTNVQDTQPSIHLNHW